MRNEKSNMYLTIILVLLAFLGTYIHEFLHRVIAFLNGWESSSISGLIVGSTDATVLANTSPISLWVFYMFPSTIIYITIFLFTVFNPNRFVRAMGTVIIGLNLASLSPEVSGSDSSSAANILISSGYNAFTATAIHWIIYVIAITFFVAYVYIVTEDNNRDAIRRTRMF